MPKPRVSPTFVIACLALFVVLSGTAYAAAKLPKNSVGAKQLKKNAVATKKIKANAVTGAKIADGTVTGADIDESTLSIPAKVTPGTITLAGTSFRPRQSSTQMTYFGSGGAVYRSAGTDLLVADVRLPQGATITSAKVLVGDSEIAINADLEFVAIDPATNTLVSLRTDSTLGSGTQTMDLTPQGPGAVVDNTKYTYQIWYQAGVNNSNMVLFGGNVSWS